MCLMGDLGKQGLKKVDGWEQLPTGKTQEPSEIFGFHEFIHLRASSVVREDGVAQVSLFAWSHAM